MKRILFSIALFVFVFFGSVVLIFYIQRDSRPVIACASLDDSIRPRDHCLMNPFRDREPEILAERILQELKNGNTEALLPFSGEKTESNKNHTFEREKEFRVESWHLGDREDSANKVHLKYWAARHKYDYSEEVHFYLERENNEWKIKDFGAIY